MTLKTLRLDGDDYAIVKAILCFINEYEEYIPSKLQVGGKVIAYTIKAEDKKLRLMPATAFSPMPRNLNALGLYEITKFSLFRNRDIRVTLRKIKESD